MIFVLACRSQPQAAAAGKPGAEVTPTGKPTPAPAHTTPLYPVRVKGAIGFINSEGTMVIEPKFERGLQFTEGLGAVMDSAGRWGYIDETGKMIIAPQYTVALPFSEGMASVRVGDLFGVINRKGELVVAPRFAGIGQFHEGLAETLVEQRAGGMMVRAWGFLKPDGEFPQELVPGWDHVGPFSEGVAAVRVFGKKWGFMDKSAQLVLKPVYEEAQKFSEGLAPVDGGVSATNKWGYIDKAGKWVITPQFTLARPFAGGLAAVQVENGKWGFIDKSAKIVIKPSFDQVASFQDDLALVKIGEKERYIDRAGKTVWQEK